MARKVVGITCSTQPRSGLESARQFLNRPYVWAVEQAGGVPIILPVTTDPAVISSYLGIVDGLMLSGGVDVHPVCYAEEPHPQLGEVDEDRDTTEMPLIRQALAEDVPLFAICRGVQALNVAMGGTLYQDLPSERPSDVFHQQREKQIPRDQATHRISITSESRLAKIVGDSQMMTNSFHHQALRDVAAGLIVTAHAPDGVIEAVELPSKRYVLGVQFHPEETAVCDEKSRKLFQAFVSAL